MKKMVLFIILAVCVVNFTMPVWADVPVGKGHVFGGGDPVDTPPPPPGK
jgi:hypothetical protein